MSTPASDQPLTRMIVAGLFSWLLPGSGHLLIGDKLRGWLFLIVITLTFWTGVAIGGVKNTVSPADRTLWFAGQICAGGHSLAALTWSRAIAGPREAGTFPASVIGYGRSEEVSVVYTAIAGMLSILVILDAMVRSEQGVKPAAAAPARTV
jgi:hypothetical protein